MSGDDADFVILGRHLDLPYRSRALSEGYDPFRDGDECVLIHPSVQKELPQVARQAQPHETGGLLVGRTLRDDQGTYVIVVGYETAPAQAGGRGTFRLSPQMTTELRERAARDYPGADVIGWWHSHHSWSGYSSVDRDNQMQWTDPRHVGLLVFAQASGPEWARVYLGAKSRELPRDRAARGAYPETAVEPPTFEARRVRTAHTPIKLPLRPTITRPRVPRALVGPLLYSVIGLALAAFLLGRLIVHATTPGSTPASDHAVIGLPSAVSTTRPTCRLLKDHSAYKCTVSTLPEVELRWRYDDSVTQGPTLLIPATSVHQCLVVFVDIMEPGEEKQWHEIGSTVIKPCPDVFRDG